MSTGLAIPRKASTGSLSSISSLSPPSVQFTIGTPPTNAAWRGSSPNNFNANIIRASGINVGSPRSPHQKTSKYDAQLSLLEKIS